MFSRRQLRRSVLAVCSLSVLFVICLTVFRENILPSKSIAADETSYLQKTTNLHSRHHHHHDQNYQHTKKRNKSQYSVLKPNRMFIDIERNRANLLLLPPTTQIPQSVDQVNNQLPLGQQVAQSQNISLKSFRGVIQRHQLHNENQLLKSNHIINVDTFEQYQPHHSQLQYRQRPQIIPSSDEYQPPLPKVDIINTTNLERFIHLDLKGAAPKINYFKQLFPLLKQLGATGLLIEYEDMFPFKGKLKSIVHGKHYTETDIQQLLETAKENNLKVMPLLQTYGHLEYVLKLKEFMHLREDVRYPQVITPCLKESYTVLFDMLDQMLNLHPDIDYLHLGCDEVYYRLVHPACLKLNFKDESDLFIRHVTKIAKYVKSKKPNIKLLIWHDMISQLYGETTNMTALTELVIPMVWAYVDDVTTWFDDIFWARLSYFREIWVSSSYKGSSGELALLSYVGHYYRNQESWLRAMHHANKQHFINFKGVAITGWSRYDHFLSLCELMPSAIPSLAYALYTARYGQITSVSNNTIGRQILGCSQIPIWEKTQYPTYITCTFPGHELYEVMFQYEGLAKQYDEVMSFTKLYVNDLHLRYNFIHYKRAQECQNKLAYLDEQMERFIDTFQQVCTLYFTPDVAIEWLQTYFMRSMNEVRNRLQFIERALKTQTYWQPRPIPNITKLVHVKKYSKANNNLERINQ